MFCTTVFYTSPTTININSKNFSLSGTPAKCKLIIRFKKLLKFFVSRHKKKERNKIKELFVFCPLRIHIARRTNRQGAIFVVIFASGIFFRATVRARLKTLIITLFALSLLLSLSLSPFFKAMDLLCCIIPTRRIKKKTNNGLLVDANSENVFLRTPEAVKKKL